MNTEFIEENFPFAYTIITLMCVECGTPVPTYFDSISSEELALLEKGRVVGGSGDPNVAEILKKLKKGITEFDHDFTL